MGSSANQPQAPNYLQSIQALTQQDPLAGSNLPMLIKQLAQQGSSIDPSKVQAAASQVQDATAAGMGDQGNLADFFGQGNGSSAAPPSQNQQVPQTNGQNP